MADAIMRYNSTSDPELRNTIYREELHAPFHKLVENIHNTFSFPYTEYEEIQLDCLCHLVLQLGKFKPERDSIKYKGQKTTAFGYFSFIAKNFLIQANNKAWRKQKNTISIDELTLNGDIPKVPSNLQYVDRLHLFTAEDVCKVLIKEFRDNKSVFAKHLQKDKYLTIANCICGIMEDNDFIPPYKKATFCQIRKTTGCKTQDIQKVIGKMYDYYINQVKRGQF